MVPALPLLSLEYIAHGLGLGFHGSPWGLSAKAPLATSPDINAAHFLAEGTSFGFRIAGYSFYTATAKERQCRALADSFALLGKSGGGRKGGRGRPVNERVGGEDGKHGGLRRGTLTGSKTPSTPLTGTGRHAATKIHISNANGLSLGPGEGLRKLRELLRTCWLWSSASATSSCSTFAAQISVFWLWPTTLRRCCPRPPQVRPA